MKKGNKYSKIVIVMIFLAALSGPVIIAKLTGFPTKCTSLSDKAASWFGFWASYSGTLATLLVALITWMNSRKMDELQRRYYELETDVNLRLSKVTIVPQILEKGKLDQYKITFVFENMAKNLIHKIGIEGRGDLDCDNQKPNSQIVAAIGGIKEVLDIIAPEYYFQDEKPVLQFYLKIDESPMKEKFAGFYYYFSQFSLDTPKMELNLKINIRFDEKDDKSPTRELKIGLLPTPMIEHRRRYIEFSEEEYAAESYEVLIEDYKME